MDSVALLQKLIEIEQALGIEDVHTVHELVIQAQECILGIQRNAVNRMCTGPFTARRTFVN